MPVQGNTRIKLVITFDPQTPVQEVLNWQARAGKIPRAHIDLIVDQDHAVTSHGLPILPVAPVSNGHAHSPTATRKAPPRTATRRQNPPTRGSKKTAPPHPLAGRKRSAASIAKFKATMARKQAEAARGQAAPSVGAPQPAAGMVGGMNNLHTIAALRKTYAAQVPPVAAFPESELIQ